MFDPVGLSFEHFDALGRYRTTENGLPIDSSGSLDGSTFDGPEALAEQLRESPELARCMTLSAYRYTTAHIDSANEEAAVIDELAASFRTSGNSYPDLVKAIVENPAFSHAMGQF